MHSHSKRTIYTMFSKLLNKRQWRVLVALVALGLAYLVGVQIGSSPSDTKSKEGSVTQAVDQRAPVDTVASSPSAQLTVVRVADGDTVTLSNGWKVRYIGIDTPELKPVGRAKDCLADEAKARNEELVLNQLVRLETDVSETDRFGRRLAYVYVGDIMVNELLVQEGLATATAYPPDVKYQARFEQAQASAQSAELGIWGELCVAASSPSPTQSVTVAPTNTPTRLPTQIPTVQPQSPTVVLQPVDTQPPTPLAAQPTTQPVSGFSCDCAKTCKQMSSCQEAYYQLQVCGCSARDGDDDGVPCEDLCR